MRAQAGEADSEATLQDLPCVSNEPMVTILQERISLLMKELQLKDETIRLKEEINQNLRNESLENAKWRVKFEQMKAQNETLRRQIAQKEESEEEEKICSICLDGMDSKSMETLLRCGHKFHYPCFQKYKGDSCPLCRRSLK